MSERNLHALLSEKEAKLLQENLGMTGAVVIAKGYLSDLRAFPKDKKMNLSQIHKKALESLNPSSADHLAYLAYHDEAYSYLKRHARQFRIRVE